MGNKNEKTYENDSGNKYDNKASDACSSWADDSTSTLVSFKIENKRPTIRRKLKDMTEQDYELLMTQTGMQKEDIIVMFEKFLAKNPGSLITKSEFTRFQVSTESPEAQKILSDISNHVVKYEYIVIMILNLKFF